MNFSNKFFIVIGVLLINSCDSDDIGWKRTKRTNTIESYKEYLQSFPNGNYEKEASVAIENIWYLAALEENTIDAWEAFLKDYPESQYTQTVIDTLEFLHFSIPKSKEDISGLKNYIELYPNGRYNKETIILIEEIEYNAVILQNTESAYKAYLKNYSNTAYRDDILFKIKSLRKAIIEFKYPKTVASHSEYEWDTEFFEKGGNVGFELKAYDFYIQAPNGDRYSNNWSESVKVSPGGQESIDYWCDYSSKWAGGFFHCIWKGKDDKGNRISLTQKVRLEK